MTVFDRMAEAANRELRAYANQVVAELEREQESKVVAGEFVGYAPDGRLEFRTPGGGAIRAFSSSGGGFPEGAIAQVNTSNPQGAFADASAPSSVSLQIGKQLSPL